MDIVGPEDADEMNIEAEPLCEVFTISMTSDQKRQLKRLAYRKGATMSGLVRRLIQQAIGETAGPGPPSARVGQGAAWRGPSALEKKQHSDEEASHAERE